MNIVAVRPCATAAFRKNPVSIATTMIITTMITATVNASAAVAVASRLASASAIPFIPMSVTVL